MKAITYRKDRRLKELIEFENVTPVIDRTDPLIGALDAVSYLGEEHARGEIVGAV